MERVTQYMNYRYYRILDTGAGFAVLDPAGLWAHGLPPWATRKEIELAVDKLIAQYN